VANDNQVVIDFVGNSDSLQASIQEVNKDLINTGKISQAAFTEFNKANQQAEQGTKQLAGNLQDLNKVVANGAIKEYSKDIEGITNKHISLRAQVQQAKQALYELAEQGKKGTKEWDAAWASAEKYSTALREINKTVATLGNQTKVFSGLIDAARGVAAGFELAKGGALLFGASAEDSEKIIKQLVPIMSTLQALQELQLLVSEESAAMQLVINGRKLAGAAATQLQTAAESENIIVSKAATAAQWALNAAMEANPVMLLVGAIGAAVAALLYFTKTEGESTEETKKFNEANEKLNETLGKQQLAYQVATGNLTEYQSKRVEILKKYAKEEEKIRKEGGEHMNQLLITNEEALNTELLNVRLENLEKLGEEEAKANLKEETRRKERLKKKHDDELKAWQQSQKDLAELLAMSDAEQQAYWKKQEEDYKNHIKALDQLKSNSDDELQFIKDFEEHKLEIEDAYNSMSFEDFKKWEQEKRKEYKASADWDKQYDDEVLAHKKQLEAIELADSQRLAQEENNAKKLAIQEAFKVAEAAEAAIFKIEADNRRARLDADLAMLEKRKNKELSNKHLTAEQIAAIDAKFHRLEAAQKLKAWKADQKAAETQAGIKMALGVVNAFATSSTLIEAVIRAAAVVAVGGIEIGVIAAQKPPQFAKGTEYVELNGAPKGTDTIHAMVNEGERIVPTHINKQLGGIKNEDLPKLLQAAYYPPIPNAPDLNGANVIINAPAIDYKQLGKAIAEEMKNNPQTHINIDKGGFALHLIEKGRRIESINNRYGI
jgi:hypothetical protein